MFHTPNIELTILQAKSMGIPIVTKITKGEKEEELEKLLGGGNWNIRMTALAEDGTLFEQRVILHVKR